VKQQRVPRFDRTERIVHWANATLFLVLIATGAALYAGPVSTLVGRRVLMKNIHVYTGLLLPIPVLAGLLLRSGAAFRADFRRLSRWDAEDRGWWRPSKRPNVELGKFNPGQKLNAVFILAAIPVMLGTGIIMRWFEPFPLDWRTGATFVHDWFAIGLFVAVLGHIGLACADPDALRGITRGWVTATWARTKRPRWYAESEETRAARDLAARAD
jgi:formate dehydrogenase subunit gamma